MGKPLAMNSRLVFVIAAGLALSGCCIDGSGCYVSYVQPPTTALVSWDGLGPLPKPKVRRAKRVPKTSVVVASEDDSPSEEALSKLKPYSKEWGAVLDAINRAYDDKLKKKLIICRVCMPPEDQTGSIGEQHAAGGYLPSRQ